MDAIQLEDLTRFPWYVSHNGAKLDQFDDKRLIYDDEEINFESKNKMTVYIKMIFLFRMISI